MGIPNPTQSPIVQAAIAKLQILYGVLPAEVRLMMADAVAAWAEKARQQALAQLGVSGPPQPQPTTYTTTGRSA